MVDKNSFIYSDNKIILLRAGFTDYNKSKTKCTDIDFEKDYKLAKENNIKIGVYYESRATSVKEAKEELDFYMNIIKNKTFEYPISIKLEDDHNTIIYYPENQKTIDKKIFCNILEYMYKYITNNNYIPLFITYEDWYKNNFRNYSYNFLLDKNKDIY